MKRIKLAMLLILAAWLLSGCAMTTVEDLYHLPRRSEEYESLHTAIQSAMDGLEYCAPLSGENQQTVQMADLEGDGVPEYLLFAKGASENPLKILIFTKTGEEFFLKETIHHVGTAFDQVEYVRMDDHAGFELVVGRQVSDQVLRTVSVYSFSSGKSELLLTANYTNFMTVNLDADGLSELFVLQHGQTDTDNGVAAIYSMENGTMERSVEANMSAPADKLKRMMVGKLHDGLPAVYTACTVGDSAMITDVYALVDGRFANVTFSNESGTSVQTLRNYYVYAEDIDEDGVIELPDLITMHTLESGYSLPNQYVIRWYAMTATGAEVDKMLTYHNFVGGWYLQLDSAWADRVLIEQEGSSYVLYVWDESFIQTEKIMTVYTLTDEDREAAAVQDNRFLIYRTDSVVYAASLEVASMNYGLTSEKIINAFRLIHQDWKTGET